MTKRKDSTSPQDGPHFLRKGELKPSVVVLKIAKDDGRDILTDFQYAHMVAIEKRLVDVWDYAEVSDLRIEKVSDKIFELKVKGGPLGRKNIRVYFAKLPEQKKVVVLKTYKKEEEAQVPRHIVINAEDRLEDYLRGVPQGVAYVGATVYAKES